MTSTGQSGPSGRVLLALTDSEQREALARELGARGVTLSLHGVGQSALDALLQDHFDLIVLDIDLPGMGGLAAADLVRASGFTGPLLAVLPALDGEMTKRCQTAGFNDAVTLRGWTLAQQADMVLAHWPATARLTRWDHLTFDDVKGFDRLKHKYCGKLAKVASDLRTAHGAQDWSALRQQSHAIKGSAGCFGLDDLMAAAARLERALIDQRMDAVDDGFVSLIELCAQHMATSESGVQG